jgi:steroid delta-isomerase
MQDALKKYVAYFEALTPQRLALLGSYFERNARFKDPYNDVEGLQNIRAVFDHMYRQTENPKFKVAYAALCEDGHTALLRWDMLFYMKGKKQVISGASEVIFSDKGLVASHIDYWDTGAYVYRKVPVLSGIIKMIEKKLATPIAKN